MKKENRLETTGKSDDTSTDSAQEPTYLLSEPSFQLLRQAQQRIREKTDITPSIRKMINILITPDSMEKMTQEMIELYRD